MTLILDYNSVFPLTLKEQCEQLSQTIKEHIENFFFFFSPLTMFRHHFTNSCFSMTVAPPESVRLGMGRGFRLCLNKFCPRSWALTEATSSQDGKGQGERTSL